MSSAVIRSYRFNVICYSEVGLIFKVFVQLHLVSLLTVRIVYEIRLRIYLYGSPRGSHEPLLAGFVYFQ